MFEKYYSINEVFVSQYGFWIKDKFMVLSSDMFLVKFYIVIKSDKDNRYKAIIPKEKSYYPQVEKATDEEKENCCLWGRIDSIYPYLTSEELESGKISNTRLFEISDIVNGIKPAPPKQENLGNVLKFRPRS